MLKPLNLLAAFSLNKLGRCRACIRKAFLAAMIGWILTCVTLVAPQSSMLSLPAEIGAGGLTLLWMAHLLVYASRFKPPQKASISPVRGFAPSVSEDQPPFTVAVRRDVPLLSRRAVMPLFVRALLFGAMTSVIPSLARADGLGPCGGDVCQACERPVWITGQEEPLGCESCHSCTTAQYTCEDDNSEGFPNGC
jgi:hypothetical protein